jgi:hypothetical protein
MHLNSNSSIVIVSQDFRYLKKLIAANLESNSIKSYSKLAPSVKLRANIAVLDSPV